MRVIAAIAAALAAVLAFGSAVDNAFVLWDDPQLIIENPLIRTHSPLIFLMYDPELYVPLTLASFQLQHLFSGFDPVAFHLGNVVLHALNASLVFWFLSLLLANRWAVFFGALLFAVHPLHAEAVAWVSARKELLYATFFLGSLIAYLRSEELALSSPALRSPERSEGRFEGSKSGVRRGFWWLSVFLFTLSALSKPTALVLPFVLLLIDFWREGQVTRKGIAAKIALLWPFFAIALITALIALGGKQEVVASLPLSDVILLAFRSTAFYLQKLFLPLRLSAIYPAPENLTLASAAQLFAVFLVLGLLLVAWFFRRRAPEVLVGVLLFLITLAPSFFAYLKSSDVTLASDRYAYLPSIGILFALASLISRFAREQWMKRAAACASLLVASTFGFLANVQANTWQSTDSLFANVLAKYPTSHVAFNNLGFLLMQQGSLDTARPYIEKAVQLKPNYADALLNLGVILARNEQYEEAEPLFRRALEENPSLIQAQFNLGGIYLRRGKLARAVEHYERTLKLDPNFVPALWLLAQVELQLGRIDAARETHRRLLNLDSSYRGRSVDLDALIEPAREPAAPRDPAPPPR